MSKLTGIFLRSGSAASGRKTLAVLVCLSVVIFALFLREGPTGPVHTLRGAVHVVTAPLSRLGAQVTAPFGLLGEMVQNAGTNQETLTELREQNAALTAQLAELGEYRLENERLTGLLDLASAYGAQGIGARVIGGSSDIWTKTIMIDKGTLDGVSLGMPVTDGNGVVGQITEISSTSATVTLLSDPGYEASALLQGSRSVGVLQGSVDGSLHLAYISASVDVSIGELVVTSGLGGVYPKGLLIGRVVSATSSPSDVYQTIVVAPTATPSTLEEVYVISAYDAAQSEIAAETLLATGSFAQQADDASRAGSGDDGAVSDEGGEGES